MFHWQQRDNKLFFTTFFTTFLLFVVTIWYIIFFFPLQSVKPKEIEVSFDMMEFSEQQEQRVEHIPIVNSQEQEQKKLLPLIEPSSQHHNDSLANPFEKIVLPSEKNQSLIHEQQHTITQKISLDWIKTPSPSKQTHSLTERIKSLPTDQKNIQIMSSSLSPRSSKYSAQVASIVRSVWNPLTQDAKKVAKVQLLIESNGKFRYNILHADDDGFKERLVNALHAVVLPPPPEGESIELIFDFRAKENH